MANSNSNGVSKLAIWVSVIVGFFILAVLLSSFTVISVGNRGVKTRLGIVVDVLDPGLHFKMPFIESVEVFNVQTLKEQTDALAASSDLQTVKTTIAVNYNVASDKVSDLYTRIGTSFQGVVIDPAIQEAVKAVTANYTAEELITKRPEVTDDIQTALVAKLALNDIQVTGVSIVNFDFSQNFNDAIEAKVTAEQNALAAKNKLDQVKYEAEQRVAEAQGEADAIKAQAAAINSQGGADYVALQAIGKWDGKLPDQMIPGQTLPFININSSK